GQIPLRAGTPLDAKRAEHDLINGALGSEQDAGHRSIQETHRPDFADRGRGLLMTEPALNLVLHAENGRYPTRGAPDKAELVESGVEPRNERRAVAGGDDLERPAPPDALISGFGEELDDRLVAGGMIPSVDLLKADDVALFSRKQHAEDADEEAIPP